MTYKNNELINCDFIKTILMIFVVIGHSFCFWGGGWFTGNPIKIVKPLIYIADWLNSFHMYAFVLVSGYVFYYLKFERINRTNYNNFSKFILTKIKRLLVPYFFVACLWVLPISNIFYNYSIRDIIFKYLLGTGPAQLWFLLMLFVLFLIYYPLSSFLQKHTIYGAILAIILYFIGLVGAGLFSNIFQIFTALKYFIFFYIGFKLRQYGFASLSKIHNLFYFTIHIVLFIFTTELSSSSGIILKSIYFAFEFVLHLFGALMAFTILQKIANLIKYENYKVLNALKKHSMPIYLIHQQIIYVIIYMLNGRINPYLHAILNFIISITISIFLSKFLMKFKITKFILGEK